MIKYYCIKDGLSWATNRAYHAGKIYLGHDMNDEYMLCITILKDIQEIVDKTRFITLAEWRDKRINSILEDE